MILGPMDQIHEPYQSCSSCDVSTGSEWKKEREGKKEEGKERLGKRREEREREKERKKKK